MAVMKGRLSRGFQVSFFFPDRTIRFVYVQYIGRRNTDRIIIKTGPYTVKIRSRIQVSIFTLYSRILMMVRSVFLRPIYGTVLFDLGFYTFLNLCCFYRHIILMKHLSQNLINLNVVFVSELSTSR